MTGTPWSSFFRLLPWITYYLLLSNLDLGNFSPGKLFPALAFAVPENFCGYAEHTPDGSHHQGLSVPQKAWGGSICGILHESVVPPRQFALLFT